MKFLLPLLCLGLLFQPAFGQITQVVLTSVESYQNQTSDTTTSLREYLVFDEADGIDNLDGMGLSINGGPNIGVNYDPIYDQVKRRQSFGTDLNAMLATRPMNGTYAFGLYDAEENLLDTRTITGPVLSSVNAFNTRLPNSPLFTFLRGTTGSTALAGTWVAQGGEHVFKFDPVGLTDFRIIMSAPTVTTPGDYFEHRYSVAQVSNGNYSGVDGGGDMGPISGGLLPYNGVTMTFSLNLNTDADDDNPTTYGFTLGQLYAVEGEFFNHFNAELTDNLFSSFVVGTTTSVFFQAIPEPSAYATILGLFTLLVTAQRRRRSVIPTHRQ